jgi:hypothetical protein
MIVVAKGNIMARTPRTIKRIPSKVKRVRCSAKTAFILATAAMDGFDEVSFDIGTPSSKTPF